MGKVKNMFSLLNGGVGFFLKTLKSKITEKHISDYEKIENFFLNKYGLEVGGPSGIFQDDGLIPVYKVIKGLDGCNFSNSTIWEGKIENGRNYNYYKEKKGIQYIMEASDLSAIPDEKYEFIISSNCLEHVANPMKAVQEWIRVVKKGGIVLLVLPNREYCFDRYRNITDFSHLLDDFKRNVGEDDLTHLDEILKFHDLRLDKAAGSKEDFRNRSLKNFENRALHHHVFNVSLLKEIFEYFNIEFISGYEGSVNVIVGRK